MAEVHVLVKGSINTDITIVWATTSLVLDEGITMVVDPGTVASQQVIRDALARFSLTPGDISHVCLTHTHLDHSRNTGMFPDAAVIDYWGTWHGPRYEYNISNRKISDNIELVMTPGHSSDSLSLLVKTDKGIVAICGDLFWSKYAPDIDPYAENQAQLEASRALITRQADWIVPGHSRMFKVER
ncbi:MAG: MBL fold metallo-hydrolase [Candidatus Auribacterota bacterium]